MSDWETYAIHTEGLDGGRKTVELIVDLDEPFPRIGYFRTLVDAGRRRMLGPSYWRQLESGKWVWAEGARWIETGPKEVRCFKVLHLYPDGQHCCVYESPIAPGPPHTPLMFDQRECSLLRGALSEVIERVQREALAYERCSLFHPIVPHLNEAIDELVKLRDKIEGQDG